MGRYYEYTRNSYGYPLYFKIFRNTCNELLRAAYIVVQSERYTTPQRASKMFTITYYAKGCETYLTATGTTLAQFQQMLQGLQHEGKTIISCSYNLQSVGVVE